MQSNWEEAHSRALREFVEKGMSFAQAARALNARFGTAYSRNAAIGRARRMGLSGPTQAQAAGHEPPRTPRRPDLRRLSKARAKNPAVNHVTTKRGATGRLAGPVPKAAAKLSTFERAAALQLRCVAITPRYLQLTDLEDGDCRYPYGGDAAGEAITFCGHPRREGSSYCSSHFHLTIAPELRERILPKAALRLVDAA
jgi:GcrA cell cycle regulator